MHYNLSDDFFYLYRSNVIPILHEAQIELNFLRNDSPHKKLAHKAVTFTSTSLKVDIHNRMAWQR
jgi:hypothetical protein